MASSTGPSLGVIAPTIIAQPSSVSAGVGRSVTFSVKANGTSPTYQWYTVSGTAAALISGATSSSYTIPSVALTNAGGYNVVVSNAAGSVTSFTVILTVTSGSNNNGSATVSVN